MWSCLVWGMSHNTGTCVLRKQNLIMSGALEEPGLTQPADPLPAGMWRETRGNSRELICRALNQCSSSKSSNRNPFKMKIKRIWPEMTNFISLTNARRGFWRFKAPYEAEYSFRLLQGWINDLTFLTCPHSVFPPPLLTIWVLLLSLA